MIILDATNRSLEVDLDGVVTTNQLPFQANYVDVTTTTYSPGQNSGATNSTTAVTLVAAPAASTQRQIKLLTIYNADTVAAIVTVQYNNNTTLRTLVKITLAIGDTLQYTDGEGWSVIQTTGVIKAGGSSAHTLLDGSVHSDTAADTVSRGSLIAGIGVTPAWDELVIGAANRVLGSDGTDAAWVQADHGAALTGLTDDDHTQYLLAAGTRALSANWDAGSFEVRAQTLQSDVVTGTAPLIVASTTKVTNLNADLLDDQTGTYYLDAANFTGTNWTDLTDAGATTLHKHDHGGQDGLADDDHTQYALLAGRATGQTITGGTASGDDLTLKSTSNVTKGTLFVAEADALELSSGTSAMELRLREPSAGGTSYTGFKAPALAANVLYTLPTADGSANQVLTTNGSATLSWAAAAASGSPTEETTTLTGTNNNFDLDAAYTYLRCNNASALVFTGFTVAGAAPSAGDRVIVHNVGTSTVRVADQDAGSTAANRAIHSSVRGQIIGANGSIGYVYDGTTSRWRMEWVEPGAPIAVPYAAGDFTTNGAGGWTVDSGDVTTFVYSQRGKLVRISVNLTTTSVITPTSDSLKVTLPNSFSGTRDERIDVNVLDAGTAELGLCIVQSTVLTFTNAQDAAWTASTNTTAIRCIIEIEVT